MLRLLLVATLLFPLLPRRALAEEQFVTIRGKTYRVTPVEKRVPETPEERAARRTKWRRILLGLTVASTLTAGAMGVLAYRTSTRLNDNATSQVEVPGLQSSRNWYFAGMGASLGAAAASLVTALVVFRNEERPRESVLSRTGVQIVPGGAMLVAGVKF
jgi:hypothetical protein